MCSNCNCGNQKNTSVQPETCGNIGMVGFLHTRLMKKIGEHPDFPNIAPEVHYELAVREARKAYINAGLQLGDVIPFQQEYDMLKEVHSLKPEELIEKLVDRGTFSILGGRILEEILAIVDSSRKVRLKVHAVRELAGYVGAMRTLAPAEKNALLVALEIAASSFEFWAGELADRNSPYRAAVNTLGVSRRRINWPDIIGGAVNCLGCTFSGTGDCVGCATTSSALASSWFAAVK